MLQKLFFLLIRVFFLVLCVTKISILSDLQRFFFYGKMIGISFVRKVVAGPKNKTIWNGVELDLTYITERLIAMAYPATGFEKTYRNSIDDVSSYFKQKHNGKCMVINVSMRQYNYQLFNNLVKQYFWPDHQAPPLTTIFVICNDMLEFLQKSVNGVIAVHCNHGKGRTGTCIIAYMLFTRQFQGAEQALTFYNKRRFIVDTYGVDQPCQRRYLDYAQKILKKQVLQPNLKAYKLVKINQKGLDLQNNYIQVSLTRTCQTKHTKLKVNQTLPKNSIPLIADIFIQIYENGWIGETQACRINFHLNFLQKGKDDLYYAQFRGQKICVNGKRSRNFVIILYFQQYCSCHKEIKPDCQCILDRERQQKQWNLMIQIIKRAKQIPQQEMDMYVYGQKQKKINQNQEILQQEQIKPTNQ